MSCSVLFIIIMDDCYAPYTYIILCTLWNKLFCILILALLSCKINLTTVCMVGSDHTTTLKCTYLAVFCTISKGNSAHRRHTSEWYSLTVSKSGIVMKIIIVEPQPKQNTRNTKYEMSWSFAKHNNRFSISWIHCSPISAQGVTDVPPFLPICLKHFQNTLMKHARLCGVLFTYLYSLNSVWFPWTMLLKLEDYGRSCWYLRK